MAYRSHFFDAFSDIPTAQWADLAEHAGPFLQATFLQALEDTGCVGGDSGWQPHHLAIFEGERLIAALPGYLKTDSYGEYVFDHGWAEAYHRYGYAYYPKWINAIPYTPVTGPRIVGNVRSVEVQRTIGDALEQLEGNGISSVHRLFIPAEELACSAVPHSLYRVSVQFQWHNYGYSTFDDFLGALTSRKRKSARKSIQHLRDAGVTIRQVVGRDVTDKERAFFYRCYAQTYLKRSGHTGYLTAGFFNRIFETMAEKLMLVIASADDQPIASALFFFDETGLYGRYWGALQPVDGLHFQCCYFEGIDFAIKHGLPLFNPGTQGEHKILRGFEPLYCFSQHRLFHQSFHQAVDNFLQQETPHIENYFNQARDALPFNQTFMEKLLPKKLSAFLPAQQQNEKA